MTTTTAESSTSVRLDPDDLDKFDRVAAPIRASGGTLLVGGRWGRSTVTRLAVGRGLDALKAELDALAMRWRPASPIPCAAASNDDNARAQRLGAPEGESKR
jgi:hypothetical protein